MKPVCSTGIVEPIPRRVYGPAVDVRHTTASRPPRWAQGIALAAAKSVKVADRVRIWGGVRPSREGRMNPEPRELGFTGDWVAAQGWFGIDVRVMPDVERWRGGAFCGTCTMSTER